MLRLYLVIPKWVKRLYRLIIVGGNEGTH